MSIKDFPFSKLEIDQLEALLFSADHDQESFDLFGFHGIVCASVISPEPLLLPILTEQIVGSAEALQDSEAKLVEQSVDKLSHHFLQQLNSGNPVQLPNEVLNNEIALTNWCIGFIEGFLSQEEIWFENQDETEVAALMLPIMTHSGLFEDEFFKTHKNKNDILIKMIADIPDNLLDLFLLYHS